jgi:hypothetical protein
MAEQLVDFAVDSFDGRGNCVETIKQKMAALAYFHWRYIRRELPTGHRLLSDVYVGMERAYSDRVIGVGNAAGPSRAALTARMLLEGRKRWRKIWGDRNEVGGRIVWCGLALSYWFLGRASELWRAIGAEGSEERLLYQEYVLVRSDLAFLTSAGERLPWEQRESAVAVAVRFRRSKTDQYRRSKVVERGGMGLAVVLELLRLQEPLQLPQSAELMTWGVAASRRTAAATAVVTRYYAQKALSALAVELGLDPKLYLLHSGRIGGATALGAANLSAASMELGGRWAEGSTVWHRYVRTSAKMVADITAALDAA